MKEEIPQILKQYYFCLLDYSLSGKMHSILSEDITKPNISFIKLVNSPKEYIKDIILERHETEVKIFL